MRILIINPNTGPAMTEQVLARARAVSPPDVELVGVTGRFGARYIASRAASAIANHAALEAYCEAGDGFDAVYLACFGDPGLLAIREIATVPVIGMADATCHLACQLGQRFSIVTGGDRWGPMLREFVAGIGLSDRLASIRTVAPSGADIAADPDGSIELLRMQSLKAMEEDGAEVIILAGAGLAGLADRLKDKVPGPVICSVEAGMRTTLMLAAMHPAKARKGSLAMTPPVDTSGLSPSLATRMKG